MPLPLEDAARSAFVRRLVQSTGDSNAVAPSLTRPLTRRIIQFWHDRNQIPEEVCGCIRSWRQLELQGFTMHLFDARSARAFIAQRLGPRYREAFERCYHPAMQADYFRLCHIFREGGCYIDADDVYNGIQIEHMFNEGRLKLQPLCYDMDTDQMVPPAVFTQPGANASSWIFYFNNNPLIAAPRHPIVERALTRATEALECSTGDVLPEIQATTGPGNLTRSVVELAMGSRDVAGMLLVLRNWDEVATTKWPLNYRRDARNWRLSNQLRFVAPPE